jgi:galactose mutarotase-like enzyme
MFAINKYMKDGFIVYELQDNATKSRITVIPERGGIITSFRINNKELLYMNVNNVLIFPFFNGIKFPIYLDLLAERQLFVFPLVDKNPLLY